MKCCKITRCTHLNQSPTMATLKDASSTPRYFGFSQRMTTEVNVVAIDHCYTKPWSSHPEASKARPYRTLFVDKASRMPVKNVNQTRSEDIEVDVDVEDAGLPTLYDVPRARLMMADCEQQTSLLRPDFTEAKEDWEDYFAAVRTTWTIQQNRLFAKVMKILQADRLCCLSIVGTKNEPVQRRLQIDKAAKRVRFAFGNIGWDRTLMLWLHNLFMEKLRGQLLTSYIEVLQTLKVKIPSLIDILLESTKNKHETLGVESLTGLVKNYWDPVISSINQQKMKRLPDNPLLLVLPGAPMSHVNPACTRRHKFWHSQLHSMGKVVHVTPTYASTANMSVANCVENMVSATRSKILEMKGQFPGRLIILIGWNVGALFALHVSLVEVVHSVVCLGFPTMGINGQRGEVDDSLYNIRTPCLFVVGEYSTATDVECLENLRERLRMDTGLVLVGGADDALRMVRARKRRLGITQAMLDRCIMEEMYEFVSSILSQALLQPENMEEADASKKHQKKKRPREMSSAAGSQTVDNIVKLPKKIKSMKMASAGTKSFIASSSGFVKKGQLKKKLGKMSSGVGDSEQKSYLHLTLPVITSSPNTQLPAPKPSLKEAAAIASAPELSTLLQSMNSTPNTTMTLNSTGPTISSNISSTDATSLLSSAPPSAPASPPNVPTTTALTLSKFLASSGLLKSSDDLDTGLDSKSVGDPLSEDIDLEDLSGSENSPVKQPPQQQKPQIVFRAGPNSSPISIPLTLTMASKMLKSGAVLKSPSLEHSSSKQIQKLLTGVSESRISKTISPTTSSPSVCAVSPSPSQSRETIPPASCSTSQTLFHSTTNTGLQNPLPTSDPSQTAIMDVESDSDPSLATILDVGSEKICPSLTTEVDVGNNSPTELDVGSDSTTLTNLPASVINMGSDTVQFKETPPGSSSAPDTVSIDLGHIAKAENRSEFKLQSPYCASPSKISLMPSKKHISLSINPVSVASSSTSSEKVHLTNPVTLSRGSVATVTLSTTQTAHSQQHNSSPATIRVFQTKSQSKPSSSSPMIQLVTSSSQTRTSKPPTTSAGQPRVSLAGMSGSQFLSTLSSNSGVIRFRLAAPSKSQAPQAGGSDLKTTRTSGKDGTDKEAGSSDRGSDNSDPFIKSSRLPSYIDLTDETSPESKKGVKTVTALAGTQTLSLLPMKKGMQSPSKKLIITPVSSLKHGSAQINVGKSGMEISQPPAIQTQPLTSTTKSESLPTAEDKSKDSLTHVTSPPVSRTATATISVIDRYKPNTQQTQSAGEFVTDKDKDNIQQTLTNVDKDKDNTNQTLADVDKDKATTQQTLSVANQDKANTQQGVPGPSNPSIFPLPPPSVPPDSPLNPTTLSGPPKSPKTNDSTYIATPKPVIASVASTRTRRIKAPKQYDL